MPTVRQICTDALMEISAIGVNDTPSATDINVALRWFQRQLDAWQADRLTIAYQRRFEFTLTSGTSTVTLGDGGSFDVDLDGTPPTWMDSVNYVNPGSSPEQEVPIGIMDRDTFAALSIKALPSALPLQCFYQNSTDESSARIANLTFWPQVTQNITIVLYFLAPPGTPTALSDVLVGPPAALEAYHYQLAYRLVGVFQRQMPPQLPQMATDSFARMKRPNVQPGLMGVDAALVPWAGGAYNILSDSFTGYGGR